MDGFQYTNNTLDFFPHSEGYVKALAAGLGGGTSYDFKYVFTYTDHLGNIRLKYAQDPSNNNQISILEEDHYYPYGLKHSGYNSFHQIFATDDGDGPGTGIVLTPVNPFLGDSHKYKYQGQERQDELGLNWDSFKWRNYDYAIGRFFNIDPLSEDYTEQSPYAFCKNSPVAYMELEGLEGVLAIFYHGGPTGGGLPTTVDKAGYTGQYYTNVQTTATANHIDFKGIIIAPGWTSSSGVGTGLNFVNDNYIEGDQVII